MRQESSAQLGHQAESLLSGPLLHLPSRSEELRTHGLRLSAQMEEHLHTAASEEARVLYVAVTRAKEHLYLLCTPTLAYWEPPEEQELARFVQKLRQRPDICKVSACCVDQQLVTELALVLPQVVM